MTHRLPICVKIGLGDFPNHAKIFRAKTLTFYKTENLGHEICKHIAILSNIKTSLNRYMGHTNTINELKTFEESKLIVCYNRRCPINRPSIRPWDGFNPPPPTPTGPVGILAAMIS